MPKPNWPLLVQLTIDDVRYWNDYSRTYTCIEDPENPEQVKVVAHPDYDYATFRPCPYSRALNWMCNSVDVNYMDVKAVADGKGGVASGSVFENRMSIMAARFTPEVVVTYCNIPVELMGRALQQSFKKVA